MVFIMGTGTGIMPNSRSEDGDDDDCTMYYLYFMSSKSYMYIHMKPTILFVSN